MTLQKFPDPLKRPSRKGAEDNRRHSESLQQQEAWINHMVFSHPPQISLQVFCCYCFFFFFLEDDSELNMYPTDPGLPCEFLPRAQCRSGPPLVPPLLSLPECLPNITVKCNFLFCC